MDNTYNIDFIARCIAGHNKTAIKSITTELENVQKQVGTNKNNISSVQAQADWNSATGVTNLFDFDKWKQGLTAMHGTVSISENSVTVQATSNDAYTKTDTLSISVMPNTKYILTWNTTATTEHNGTAYIFPNSSAFKYTISTNERLEFTTGSGDTSVTIRFGVDNSGDSITYSNIMWRSGTITDNTYQPYAMSNAELTAAEKQNALSAAQLDAVNSGIDSAKVAQYDSTTELEAEDRAALVEIVDGGAKNRWKITIPATLPTGFTATIDTDGGLILNGETGSSALTFTTSTQFHGGETVVLSGCPAGGSDESYRIDILRGDNTNYCYGDPVIASGFAETTYQARIRIAPNYTCNNLKFFPMVCTKAAWDISHAYQPYRPSYQELYEIVKALQANQ